MRVDETIQQAEAVVRFTQEVDRRLAECGIGGAAELLAIYRQLRDTLAKLPLPELEWALEESVRLEQRLQALATEIRHLCALKAAFGVQH
jgi:lipase chaperone LimK